MQDKILISIINWNDSEATNACLDSIANIPKNRQPDVYLIDNDSQKEELILDKSTVDKLKSFTLVKNKQTLGYAGAHNKAIKYAIKNDYDYICLLNNDVELVSKGLFVTLADAIEKNDDAVAASPTIVYQNNPDKIWYGGGKMNLKTLSVLHKRAGEKLEAIKNTVTAETEFLTGCCLMISLKKGLPEPYLDESYFLYWEDTDWCAGALKAKKKLLYVPEVVLKHDVSSSLGILSGNYTYYNLRNRILFAKKWSSVFIALIQCLWISGKLYILCLKKPAKLPKIIYHSFRGIFNGLIGVKGALK